MMIKVKTAELKGAALDWAVCKAEGDELAARNIMYPNHAKHFPTVSPSTNWAQGGPIIESENINIVRCNDLYFPSGNEHGEYYEQYWKAEIKGETDLNMSLYKEHGPTPLISAMRCYVAATFGDEVDIPEELINDNEADRKRRGEPIYQECINGAGLWQDTLKQTYDDIVAGRLDSKGVRILYTAPQPTEPVKQSVPDGYVMVKADPTLNQIKAGAKAAKQYMDECVGNSPAVIYRAMLSAAPKFGDGNDGSF